MFYIYLYINLMQSICGISTFLYLCTFCVHLVLRAIYRPCEEVWVVESKQSFKSKNEALQLRDKLKKLGYDGAYLIEMVAWE